MQIDLWKGVIMRRKKERIAILLLSIVILALWGSILILWILGRTNGYGSVEVIEAPEQTESMLHPYFVKEVYEPVIPAGTNIALDAKITANGFQDVYTPRKAADGKTEGNSYWEGENDAYPNILTATFQEAQNIHAIKVCLCPKSVWSKRTQTFGVEISKDGENYTELLPITEYLFDPDTANEVVLEFGNTECMSMRLVFTGNSGAGGAQVAELEIYN